VRVSELTEFIVPNFWGTSYIGQRIMEHVARVVGGGEKSFGGRPEGQNHWEGLSVDEVIILKWILKK